MWSGEQEVPLIHGGKAHTVLCSSAMKGHNACFKAGSDLRWTLISLPTSIFCI